MPARILVVDDEPDLVDLLTFNLASRGYEVITASTGLGALRQARRHSPDLILLDLMLEGMDGYSVCEILRSRPATAQTPVIFVSAVSGELARLNGVATGANDFVRKPFSTHDLLRRVAALLATRPGRRCSRNGERTRPRVLRTAPSPSASGIGVRTIS